MTEKEWMIEAKKRLEKEDEFLNSNIYFKTRKNICYLYEILR